MATDTDRNHVSKEELPRLAVTNQCCESITVSTQQKAGTAACMISTLKRINSTVRLGKAQFSIPQLFYTPSH